MGWFSPVKGSYPSLAQVDKTLPVKSGDTAITRGTILALVAGDDHNSDGVFKIADKGTDKELFYVSLQDYNDPTAGYAGEAFNPASGVPAVTGIDLAQDGEYETTEFDSSKTYPVGTALTVVSGKLVPAAGEDPVIGYVTRPVTKRWINNAIALPNGGTDPRLAIRTGANKDVIRFKTAV